ncbi:Topoisomerase 1-associated factor 1 [Puccinia graminis f. sp. tritici]|uniref:Topoisomerase 1-associated factor 1 n=1 Tax=Puccinia graminis f. sp. tritici TaxID=56615 RepID=A0A5B0RCD3_PUCGR|nr:Topoisomerase 1-associated factor 1 [Puccinia graminis f. sp. tritici]
MKILRGVAIEFIESGFNLERKREIGGNSTNERDRHDFDLVADLMEPECMLWVFGKIQSGLEDKPMPIVEIHAAVECLIQQLLVIEGLTTSGVEDYTQVANVMLNRLYYDADTLDMVIKLMSKYTNQSLKYLENIVHFSFVFLKILERYAGSTDYMYVRKKKKARKSKQKQTGLESADQVDGGADEGETRNPVEDEEEAFLEAERSGVEFAEHKFEFGKFQQRFAHEAVASTLITYLRGYRDFTDPELMKRVVKLMYRQAVGASAPQLFYRVSVLDTFNTMIEEKSSMPKHPVYTDLFRFIDYILKQYFKSVGESPFIIIEALCNHGMRDWNRTFDSSSEDSDGMPSKASTSRKVPKLPVEIEVRPGLSWSQRLGVAVGLLVDKSKSDLVNKVQDILRTASASRTAIVLMNDEPDDDDPQVDLESWLQHSGKDPSEELRAQLKQPSDTSMGKFEDHRAEAGEDNEFKTALARDAELHMLLRLLSWESEEDIKVIDHFLINPLDHDGKSPAELTKKKRKRRAKLPELTPAELALDDSTDSDKQQAARKHLGSPRNHPKSPGSVQPQLQSLNRSSEVNGLKRNAGMIDGQGEGENEDDGISGVKRKPIKSRKLFIDDSDEDS